MPSPSNHPAAERPVTGGRRIGATDEEALHCQRTELAAAQPAHEDWAAIGETESVPSIGDIVVENTRGPTFQSDLSARGNVASHWTKAFGPAAQWPTENRCAMFGMAVEKEAELTPS